MIEINSEQSRIRAALVNSGKYSFEEADRRIQGSRISVSIGPEAAFSEAGQAALLTSVATGVRCFGTLSVDGQTQAPLLTKIPVKGENLEQAIVSLGGTLECADNNAPRVLIGPFGALNAGWVVQANWDGWTAKVIPGARHATTGKAVCAIPAIAAGAMAVGQAFLAEQGSVLAGKRPQMLSLWDSAAAEGAGPVVEDLRLPAKLWFLGLGNLGQACLWSISSLPYLEPNKAVFYLQDDEKVGPENWGTSILVERGRYGILKTKACEEWATRRGFDTRRIDRRFDAGQLRRPDEPAIALAGLDKIPTRKMLSGLGFDWIIDAGLGATSHDYQKLRITVFDEKHSAALHFADVEDRDRERADQAMKLPAYQRLATEMADGGCGAATLAGKSVAVPFVSAIAGALVAAQVVRISSGEAPYGSLTVDTGDVRTISAEMGNSPDRLTFETIDGAFG